MDRPLITGGLLLLLPSFSTASPSSIILLSGVFVPIIQSFDKVNLDDLDTEGDDRQTGTGTKVKKS